LVLRNEAAWLRKNPPPYVGGHGAAMTPLADWANGQPGNPPPYVGGYGSAMTPLADWANGQLRNRRLTAAATGSSQWFDQLD